jgi:hypothetical protein
MADLGPAVVTGAAVVVGGLLAVGGGVATQLIQARASSQARADTRRDQRDELQRLTILELQEAVYRYAKAVGSLYHHNVMAHRAGATWGKTKYGAELAEEEVSAMVRIRLLSERVRDDSLRGLAAQFATQGVEVTSQRDEMSATSKLREVMATQQALLTRSGDVLRPLL